MSAGVLRVQVLGPVRAWLDATEIRLGPPRQRALFAVLVFRRNHVVSRSELINAVWGDDAPTTAEGSVYTYLSGLRKVLEPGRSGRTASTVLPSEGIGYRLRLDPGAVDLAGFEELLADAEAALGRGLADDAVGLANRALAMWQGEPLSGLPGPFAESCRTQLTAARLRLLETGAEAGLLAGRHADLVAELSTLVAHYPLHERLRGLLMTALYRSGRQADALEQFREARQVLADELDRQPGPELVEIHQRILVNDPAIAAPENALGVSTPVPSSISVPVTTRPRPRAMTFVGRETELAVLQDAVSELIDGRGRAVWLSGEPGIGKTELLTRGLAGLDYAAVQTYWGAGDELAQRFPLRTILECLHVTADSPDPRRARVAELAWPAASREDVLGGGGNVHAVVEALLDLVRRLCDDGPLALVLDGMQWVDEASLLVFNRLATLAGELPLLVLGACRSMSSTEALDALRDTVTREGGAVLRLLPLSDADVGRLLRVMIGAVPGPGLIQLARGAAGNPLYVEELVDALKRDGSVHVESGAAEVSATTPISLASALEQRLGFLSPTPLNVLRRAALLGIDFRVDDVNDLAVVLGQSPAEFLPSIDEATKAGILVVDGARVAFRHPLIRQALYDAMAPAVRAALHRQAAERLHNAGAAPETVARQLSATPLTPDRWTIAWVCEYGERVADWAPDIGVDLLRRSAEACDATDPRVETLTAGLARVLYWLGESPESEVRAVLGSTRDPDLRGEMHWTLACVHYRRGLDRNAVDSLRAAVDDPRVSPVWRARCRALLAARQGLGLGEIDSAQATAWAAIHEAEAVGDAFAKGYALANLWLFQSIERDHAEALRLVDQALAVLDEALAVAGADPKLVHLRLSLLDNRVFSLQCLDLLGEADATLREADRLVRAHRLPAGIVGATVVNHYWSGRWDAAVTELSELVGRRELDMAFHGLRESGPTLLLLHGVGALIAVLCDRGDEVNRHLAAADELPLLTSADRESCDFLVVAEALAAERDGRPDAALIALAPVLDERYSQMMLRHQWMPDVARIALLAGETGLARRALAICEGEARRERTPARASAALARCRGLVRGDPEPVLIAAATYREVGRPVELAQTLEDAAVLFASVGQPDRATQLGTEMIRIYDDLGAVWAIHRARARLSAHGVDLARARSGGTPRRHAV
ncbi:BTAD domain-containing putative transcriptional regulator [Actinophytocola oryzae]|uniref:DNA-binding SARP family transcriptional activator n=1 Tax=Actinophytocola oryzae TaxID=502181 RepID=A0A4R7VHU8_9PSEU|nr:BTAD domain-containing putative transcriptional regulator [Actinophytocola oryzae]TDV48658.1 DNA-binding SARP family transcriptional activator [Actinophytocola oryzae]